MADEPHRSNSKVLGWISLALLALAAVAVAAPLSRYVVAASDKGFALRDGGRAEVHAPGGRTWGLYFDDADNSGYSESCTATDSAGRPIAIRDPGPTISSSDTEMLDHVFSTPSDGHFTIACDVHSAAVRVGPAPDFVSLFIGIAAAALLGLCGVITGTVWLTRRSAA